MQKWIIVPQEGKNGSVLCKPVGKTHCILLRHHKATAVWDFFKLVMSLGVEKGTLVPQYSITCPQRYIDVSKTTAKVEMQLVNGTLYKGRNKKTGMGRVEFIRHLKQAHPTSDMPVMVLFDVAFEEAKQNFEMTLVS